MRFKQQANTDKAKKRAQKVQKAQQQAQQQAQQRQLQHLRQMMAEAMRKKSLHASSASSNSTAADAAASLPDAFVSNTVKMQASDAALSPQPRHQSGNESHHENHNDGFETLAPASAGDTDSAYDEHALLQPELFAQSSQTPRKSRRPELTAKQRAIGLLTRREHSRKELTRKLTARGVPLTEARSAVDDLHKAGWQDDARFAESIVRSRAGAGYGPLRIRAELAMHGLPETLISNALQQYQGNWLENAQVLVHRRFAGALEQDWQTKHKMAAFLLRRGFALDDVRSVCQYSDAIDDSF